MTRHLGTFPGSNSRSCLEFTAGMIVTQQLQTAACFLAFGLVALAMVLIAGATL
ncbi:MAG TPA: hypothetical protein VFS39_00540 [Nitrospira sp.]|nr:hypothetical protein [Nitrospira sp.]